MEAVHLSMPGYRANEYLLVLLPHEELRNKIHKLRDEFAEQYRAPMARQLKSHLVLASFTSWEMLEEKILHRLQSIAMGVTPFKVELKDYGSFPTHSIYIKV